MTWLRPAARARVRPGPEEFLDSLKVDLFEDEVFVFTPKGEVKNLSAGSTPLDFAYAVHTDVGHRCVGAKVNGKIVPLHYQLQQRRHRRDPDREAGAGPVARLAQPRAHEPRPQQDPRLPEARAPRGRRAPRPREAPGGAAKARPAGAEGRRRRRCSSTSPARWASARPTTSTSASARARSRRRPSPTRSSSASRQGEAVGEEDDAETRPRGRRPARQGRAPAAHRRRLRLRDQGRGRRRRDGAAREVLPPGARRRDRRLRLARPRDHDPSRGLQERRGADEGRRSASPRSRGTATTPTSYRVELQVDAWDRTRLLEDLSRTFAEAGINILEATCVDQAPDGQEPLRGRGRRHQAAQAVHRAGCATSTRSSTPTASRRPSSDGVERVRTARRSASWCPFAGDARRRRAPRPRARAAASSRDGDELIVADNTPAAWRPRCSTAATDVVARATGERSSYHARNAGAARATREWILFIDADCAPAPELLDAYFAEPVGRAGRRAGRADPRTPPASARSPPATRGRATSSSITGASPGAIPTAPTGNLLVRRDGVRARSAASSRGSAPAATSTSAAGSRRPG